MTWNSDHPGVWEQQYAHATPWWFNVSGVQNVLRLFKPEHRLLWQHFGWRPFHSFSFFKGLCEPDVTLTDSLEVLSLLLMLFLVELPGRFPHPATQLFINLMASFWLQALFTQSCRLNWHWEPMQNLSLIISVITEGQLEVVGDRNGSDWVKMTWKKKIQHTVVVVAFVHCQF